MFAENITKFCQNASSRCISSSTWTCGLSLRKRSCWCWRLLSWPLQTVMSVIPKTHLCVRVYMSLSIDSDEQHVTSDKGDGFSSVNIPTGSVTSALYLTLINCKFVINIYH